jgi:hypothetical protein
MKRGFGRKFKVRQDKDCAKGGIHGRASFLTSHPGVSSLPGPVRREPHSPGHPLVFQPTLHLSNLSHLELHLRIRQRCQAWRFCKLVRWNHILTSRKYIIFLPANRRPADGAILLTHLRFSSPGQTGEISGLFDHSRIRRVAKVD